MDDRYAEITQGRLGDSESRKYKDLWWNLKVVNLDTNLLTRDYVAGKTPGKIPDHGMGLEGRTQTMRGMTDSQLREIAERGVHFSEDAAVVRGILASRGISETTPNKGDQATNKPGKSPEDLFNLIVGYVAKGEVITAPKLLELYIQHWQEFGFEKPVEERNSALRTIERDLYSADNSLVNQGYLEPLMDDQKQWKRGENREYLFRLIAKKGFLDELDKIKEGPTKVVDNREITDGPPDDEEDISKEDLTAPSAPETPRRYIEIDVLHFSAALEEGRRADQDIDEALIFAGQAGLQIPTHPNERYNLLVTSEFFANGELEKHRTEYGDRFDLDRVSGTSSEQFVDNILAKASGKETRTIALVPNDLPAEQLERLAKVGIRFIRVNTTDLQKARADKDANREKFQIDTYAMMLLLRRVDNSITANSSIYRLLSFYLRSHFALTNEIAVDDYIMAIVNNDVARLIKGYLAYRPAEAYETPDYNKVAVTLISA